MDKNASRSYLEKENWKSIAVSRALELKSLNRKYQLLKSDVFRKDTKIRSLRRLNKRLKLDLLMFERAWDFSFWFKMFRWIHKGRIIRKDKDLVEID